MKAANGIVPCFLTLGSGSPPVYGGRKMTDTQREPSLSRTSAQSHPIELARGPESRIHQSKECLGLVINLQLSSADAFLC